MGHDPDPAAEAEQLRGLIRDAHAAVKDLRAAIRDAQQLGAALAASFQDTANREIHQLANHVQAEINQATEDINARVAEVQQEIARRMFDARIVYDQAADNFAITFPGPVFRTDTPPPYPERTPPR